MTVIPLVSVFAKDGVEDAQAYLLPAVENATRNGVAQVQEQLIGVFDANIRAAILAKDKGNEVLATLKPGELMADTIRYGFSVPSTGLAAEATKRLQAEVQAVVSGKVSDYIAKYCPAIGDKGGNCYPSADQLDTWARESINSAANKIANEMFGTSANTFIGALRDIRNFDVQAYLTTFASDYLRNLFQWYIQQQVRIIAERAIPIVGPAIAWWDGKVQELKLQKEKYDKYIEEMQALRDLRIDMSRIGREHLDELFRQGNIQAIITMPPINAERNSAGGISREVQLVQSELHANMMARMAQQSSIPLAFRAAQTANFVATTGAGVSAPVAPPTVGNVSSEADRRDAEGKAAVLGMTVPDYPFRDISSLTAQQAMMTWAQLTAKSNLAYSSYMASYAAEPEMEQVFTMLEAFTPEKINQLSPGQAFACRGYVSALMTRIDMGRLQARLREERLFSNAFANQVNTRETLMQLKKGMPIGIAPQ